MQPIAGILFEPVGCLAEFPAEPFLDIAALVLDRARKSSRSGSRAYWHLLNLMEESGEQKLVAQPRAAEALELAAVEAAALYEDVIPALTELRTMNVKLCIASSLSAQAIERFLSKHALHEFFSAVCTRDSAHGIKTAPLVQALTLASLNPESAIFLTDTAAGLTVANSLGVSSILMMNDPDEARRLTAHQPTGGLVSLHELPDFVRFVSASPQPG